MKNETCEFNNLVNRTFTGIELMLGPIQKNFFLINCQMDTTKIFKYKWPFSFVRLETSRDINIRSLLRWSLATTPTTK